MVKLLDIHYIVVLPLFLAQAAVQQVICACVVRDGLEVGANP
jgi:hypothetical protein